VTRSANFREPCTPEAKFSGRPPLGRWVNRGYLPTLLLGRARRAPRQDAPVGVELGPGGVGRLLGGQVEHRVGRLLGGPEAPERRVLDEGPYSLLAIFSGIASRVMAVPFLRTSKAPAYLGPPKRPGELTLRLCRPLRGFEKVLASGPLSVLRALAGHREHSAATVNRMPLQERRDQHALQPMGLFVGLRLSSPCRLWVTNRRRRPWLEHQ
jgi:hypothetical protein